MANAIEHNIELRLLGPFSLSIGGKPLPSLRTRKGQWLLSLLALHAGAPVDRSRLAGMLWPDSLEEQSLCNLRRALTDLRSALGPAAGRIGAPTPRTLSLDLGPDDMADIYLFQQLVESDEISALKQAAALYRGHLLEGCDEHWVHKERAAMELSYTAVIETLAARNKDQGSELAQQQLLRNGSPPHAACPGRLPRPLTALIGRTAEIVSLEAALSIDRLITLIGAGGIGKTRLAIHAAESAGDQFRDGAWFADLSGTRTPELIASFVASALEIPEDAAESPMDRLTGHLNQKEILLVLDNCEHVVSACANLAEQLLNACPRLKIIATSREPLGIHGEHRWSVPALSTPAAQTNADAPADLEELRKYDSVRLFIERGMGHQPGFELTAQNMAAVIEICNKLDGIPLSIELAAARLSVVTPEQIATRLKDRFRLLTGGSRTAWPRHQTLLATIEWSHDLLSDTEKLLFRRLAVYSGGWTVDDLECAGFGDADRADQLDVFTSLFEKSLIQADTEIHGERRYRMLESIREFAIEKLKSAGEWSDACRYHASYFLSVAETASAGMLTPDREACVQRLISEHDNMRSAMEWAICEPGLAETAARMASSLSRFWYVQCLYREGLRWLEQVLELEEPIDPIILCKVYNGAGSMNWVMGRFDAAQAYYERHLAMSREQGDEMGLAYGLMNLGLVAMHRGEYPLARSRMEESIALIRNHGDRNILATPLHNLAIVAKDMGELDYAFQLLEEGYALNQEQNHRRGMTATLILRANLERRLGKNDIARKSMLEVLALSSEPGDRQSYSIALHNLGDLSLHEGDCTAARVYYSECLSISYELGDRRQIATTLCSLGQLNRSEGNLCEYRSMYRQSADLAIEMKERVLILTMLIDLASQSEISGDIHTIPRIAGAINSAIEQYGTPLNELQKSALQHITMTARRQLGDESYCSEFAEGQSTPLNEALNTALAI